MLQIVGMGSLPPAPEAKRERQNEQVIEHNVSGRDLVSCHQAPYEIVWTTANGDVALGYSGGTRSTISVVLDGVEQVWSQLHKHS